MEATGTPAEPLGLLSGHEAEARGRATQRGLTRARSLTRWQIQCGSGVAGPARLRIVRRSSSGSFATLAAIRRSSAHGKTGGPALQCGPSGFHVPQRGGIALGQVRSGHDS